MAEVRFFGIRHHGPGCARSLVRAFAAWQPDAVLVEGPPEADGLLPHLNDAALVPPVALLVHAVETPQQAVFYPFARFSPEWQALRWAAGAGVAARFIDLPRAHALALDAGPLPDPPPGGGGRQGPGAGRVLKAEEMNVGMEVWHESFGWGTVLQVLDHRQGRVKVDFAEHGSAILLASYARLRGR